MPLKGIFDIETDSEGRKSFKWLVIFCIALFALWSALPMILLENTYIDILENIVWSRHFQFGYDKNPYFGAWLTQACYILSGHGIWINYVLSQLSVLIGFLCVWKLARSFLPPLQSLISVMLLTGVLFYGSKTIEFNDDVLEIALWSLSMLFFHRALTKQQLLDWLFVGLWTGLAFMTKYYGLVLFASMGLVMLLTKEGRGSFRKPGPWLSLALFLVLSLPNIVWLWQNDFVAIRYAMGRAKLSGKTISDPLRHLTQPLDFLQRMLSVIVPTLIAFSVIFFRRDKSLPESTPFNRIFFSVLCWGPFAFTFVFSIITASSIRYSWMTPGFLLVGIFMVMFWRPLVNNLRFGLLLLFVLVFSLVCAGIFSVQILYTQPYLKKNCSYETFPGAELSKDLTSLWRETYGTPLKYVIGEREEACNIAVFSKDSPEAFFSANLQYSQWIKREDIVREGAVIVWKGGPEKCPDWLGKLEIPAGSLLNFPARSYPRAVKGWFKSILGKEPVLEPVSFSFIKPQSVGK